MQELNHPPGIAIMDNHSSHNEGNALSDTTTFPQRLADHFAHEVHFRSEALSLSPETLATLIPHGPYCYTVLAPLPPPAIGHKIAPCPFLIGSRPDTTCFRNPNPHYAIDTSYNIDACKCCGINDPDTVFEDAH